MALVKRFEDLIAWQKGRQLAVAVYRLTDEGKISTDFVLADQLHRAGLSIPSNVAEGFDRGSKAEFHRYLTIARASCAELRSHLYIAEDLGYVGPKRAAELRRQAEEVSAIVGALRHSVQKQRRKTLKRSVR